MKTSASSIQSMNEIIFENKNKAYGAYVIRSTYDTSISTALLMSIALAGVVSLLAFWLSQSPNVLPKIQGQTEVPELSVLMDVTPKELPRIIEKIEPQKIEKTELPPKSDNLNLVASDDKKDVLTSNNSTATIIKNGTTDGSDSAAVITEVKPTIAPTVTNDAQIAADEMPEFNGNLFQYIKNKIQYPYIAKENLTSGTVVLQFIVEKDGSIGNIKVLNAVADGCTEEAIRVVKSMPKWKPGKNKGEPVRVLFNLPVRFIIK
ncbi:MAG: TonB family protein [Bacteroidia bacterium]